jgi:predicted  nucleic acid-binding Zn-ribbon protein
LIARTRDLKKLENEIKEKKDMADSIRFQIEDLNWKLENLECEIEDGELRIAALKVILTEKELPPKYARSNPRPDTETRLECFEAV